MILTNERMHTRRLTRRAMLAGTATFVTAPAMRGFAQTPSASPVARGGTYLADARDRLRSLLALLPADVLGGPDPTSELFSWSDLETQFFAHGIDEPTTQMDAAVEATLPLAITDDLMQYAMDPQVREALGFSVLDVHQILVAGVPPDRVSVYAGGVDFGERTSHWEETGYERRTGSHGEYWTLGEEGEIDFNRATPLNIGSLNNVALLADDIAVFTRTYATLERVLAHQGTGDDAATVGDEHLSLLIDTLPSDTVNVMAFPGDTFRADTMVPENPGRESSVKLEDLLAQSDDAVGPMPPLLLGMFGVTSGVVPAVDGTPPSAELEPHAFMAFITGSEEDAQVAAEVAFWRLANMQSPTTGEVYRDRFVPVNTPEEAAEGRVMTVTFGADVATTGAWNQMVLMRDTWPFAWLEQ